MAEQEKRRLIQDINRSRGANSFARPVTGSRGVRTNYTDITISTAPKPARTQQLPTVVNVPPQPKVIERIVNPPLQVEEDLLEEVSAHMKPASNVVHAKKHKRRKEDPNPEKRQTIEHHINELRRRALWCVIALIIGGVIGYKFQAQIIAWLVKPLGQQLFYTSPTGGFDFLIKICLFFGFLLAIPIIIYNIIRFVAPALPKHVTYSTAKILLISVFLALGGVAFAYFVSLPAALHFLNGFTNQQIDSLISAQEYFNFVMIYLAGFAALFQMPLLFAFINKIRPMKPMSLMKKQRIIVLISFIIAAVLTPTPDPINQTIMAVPIIVLYQASIIVVWQQNKRTSKKNIRSLRRESLTATA